MGVHVHKPGQQDAIGKVQPLPRRRSLVCGRSESRDRDAIPARRYKSGTAEALSWVLNASR